MRKCHWCDATKNLKGAYCEGETCLKETMHNTSVCRNCYKELSDIDMLDYDNWYQTDYWYKPKQITPTVTKP